jgi:hypothetical protein
MAIIKMEMSEYEAMKKVEALLEKSLEREKEQAEEIKKITEERVKVLEENDKSVTIIKVKKTSETKMSYYPQDEIIRRIQQYLNSQSRGYSDHHRMMHNDEMMRNSMSMDHGHLHSFFDSFFDTRTHEFETKRTVVRKGLDEVTTTIREELKDELDQSTNDKFTHLSKLISEKTKWNRDLTESKEYGKTKNKEANRLSKSLDLAEGQIVELRKANEKFQDIVENQPVGLLAIRYKRRLLQSLKEKKDDKG